ncbi:alpha/beta hydrolase [Pseudonocardiaceae bacterium YIM PH 21723]|nr:alpha/beta hydrolase [Pseudonocardiaceae bacterium YIM PH 21723]
MKRVLLASALSATLLLTALPMAQAATLDWTPCGDESECTTVTVPIDWAKPDGPTIDLEVARHKASGKSHGTMVLGDGGPGGKSADWVKSFKPDTTSNLGKNFDLIGVNARGLGKGYEVSCATQSGPEHGLPSTPEEFATLNAENRAFAEKCRELTGPLYDHLDTASNARDLEAVRAAIGVEKVSYYGISYGTLLGQQYAQLFPQRVEHMVLDSTMDHSIPDGTTFSATEAKSAEDNFGRFIGWCDKTESCALHGDNVPAVVHTIQQKVAAGQVKDAKGRQFTGITLDALTFRAVNGEWAYPELATELKTIVDTGISTHENRTYPSYGTVHAILCQDWNFQLKDYADYQGLLQRVTEVAPLTRMSDYTQHTLSCQGWPVANTNPPKPAGPQPSSVLVLNGRYDYATVYAWAENLSAQTGWTLLTYDGGSHGTYGSRPCMTEYSDTFLLTGQLPPKGTHCAEVPGGTREQQQQRPADNLWAITK